MQRLIERWIGAYVIWSDLDGAVGELLVGFSSVFAYFLRSEYYFGHDETAQCAGEGRGQYNIFA